MKVEIGHFTHFEALDWRVKFILTNGEYIQEFIRIGTVSGIGREYRTMKKRALQQAGEAFHGMMFEVGEMVDRDEFTPRIDGVPTLKKLGPNWRIE